MLTTSLPGSTDVVVVGAGVIGSSIAYYLRKAGLDVLLIDRRHTIASGTSSQASAGGVRQQGRLLPEIPLAIHSINMWADLEGELGVDIGYRQDGMTIALDDQELLPKLEARVQQEQAQGLDVRVVQDAELYKHIPGLAPGMVAGSYCSSDGHADPMRTTNAFAIAAERLGAHLVWDCQVQSLQTHGDKLVAVRTSRGDVASQYAVLAAGAWTSPIAATVGLDIPIRPGAIQMMITAPQPHVLDQVLAWIGHSISLKQIPNGSFLIGGGWPGDFETDTYHTYLNPGSMAKSAQTTVRLFPALRDVTVVRAWLGIEGFCIDDKPIISSVPGLDGLLVAAGFSGHGFALAPGVGALTAEYVSTGRLPALLRPFSLARFGEQNKGF